MLTKSALLALFTALAAAAPATPFTKRDGPSGFNWGNEKVRGLNLGGWLVLEPWITPSIFDNANKEKSGIVDEFTLCGQLGVQRCHDAYLKPHWDQWVSLGDFQRIKNSGFNLVRIPIGFWAYDNGGTPYSQGAAPYMDKAIGWARQVGLKVIIDLHGAPGSQNGFDNSGQRGVLNWQQGDNTRRTLNVLYTMQKKYAASAYDDVVAAIELLNEPLTPNLDMSKVRQFWYDGYGQQRTVSQSRVVMIQDGFQNDNTYNGMLSPSDNGAQNVALDHHEYQVFNNDLVKKQPWEHRQLVCNNAGVYSGADKWTIVGEWSGAMTDCARYLNGYGVGARYDGSYPGSSYVGSCNGYNNIGSWSQTLKDDVRGYIEAQLQMFEARTNGWVFWNFKTENAGAPEWDAYALMDAGVFPQPLTSRKFSKICNNA